MTMNEFKKPKRSSRSFVSPKILVALTFGAAATASVAGAQDFSSSGKTQFWPGNLLVSRSVYDNNPNNVKIGTILPPNCASTQAGCAASTGAPYDGTYPLVWNNDAYDSSFGITSKIYLDQITPFGRLINSLEVPNSQQRGVTSKSDQLVTSFSSKSELALNLATDGKYITFNGYVAPVNTLDASNSNTPLALDPTNPVGENIYRAVAQMDAKGKFRFTETNAYSGNNGRASILYNTDGYRLYFTAGNAGNGATPQPNGVILGAGAQIIDPSKEPEKDQDPGTPTPVASFSVTQLGATPDKIGKDDNFRGLRIFDNVLYYSKGSGSNGVNTVYFVDTTGTACPKGIGVPSASAKLPTEPLSYNLADLQTDGLPNNMCILAGFPSTPNKTAPATMFPFGLWFADAKTLYVADEGDGYAGGADLYTHAAAQTTAGLQKWVLDISTNRWSLAYTLQAGLNLGIAYTVPDYPSGINPGTKLPWAPATDGLRNITGHVNHDGTVTIWAITSTVSGNGDTGADPNQLVAITDALANTSASGAGNERFFPVRKAGFGEVLRGVSFTPSSDRDDDRSER
jgi:hypothetical protein